MRQLIAGNWKMHGLAADAVALAQAIAAGTQQTGTQQTGTQQAGTQHAGTQHAGAQQAGTQGPGAEPQATAITAAITAEVLICPTALHVAAVADAVRGSVVAVGGQDCHQARQGAHTGDIAAPMLRDAGAAWVILGHSERRQNHGETDELVREKTLAAVAAGLIPIVCVGETEDQRAGGQETEVVGWQIAGSLPKPFTGVIAYEPIWAIGSGRTATEGRCRRHARLHP